MAPVIISGFLFSSVTACVDGSGTEPEPTPETSEPEAVEDAEYGTLTVRLFDDNDAVVCETTLTSTTATPDENFRAGWSYEGLAATESSIVSAGTIDVDAAGGNVASVSILVTRGSGDQEIPPGASSEWGTTDVDAAEGIIGCVQDDGDLFSLQFDADNAIVGLTAFTSSVTSVEATPGFESGWSDPAPENCLGGASGQCQLFGATGAFSMTAAGTGVNAITGETVRFEAELDATNGAIGAIREAN